jgi:subtilase family serine protease
MNRLLRQACLTLSSGLLAASAYALPSVHPLQTIHGTIDEGDRVGLQGNTRPEAVQANDLGAVADEMAMPHLLLQLKRSPESETALRQYIDQLHDSKSPNFHQWLTPEQFASNFGVASEDVAIVTTWLLSKGLTVNGVSPTGLTIDFGGTAAQVRSAFHTDIHHLSVKGVTHFANVSDPQLPRALSSAVAGVVALHDFYPKPHKVARGPSAKYTFSNASGTFHALAAPDLATIYNLTPLFAAGFSGKGQSIMVVEDTYLYSTTDFTQFRKTFGLSRTYPSGSLTQVSPTGAIACANPGFQGNSRDPGYGDDGEAAIDVEWATAAAPNAAIILAACTDTSAFGGLIALQNTLNGPAANLPSVVSISYGEAEATNGAAANLAYNNAYQQAVAEGVSIFVSSGDELAASADGGNASRDGIAISGFASTPYNVAVGGTDFGYTANAIDPSVYWSATNTASYGSALSYIQEVPWNDSCAGILIANFLGTSPAALCNNASVTSASGSLSFLLNASGGSGGPSGCATGTASTRNVVSGNCAGYAKPSWQAGTLGNPNDGVRDIPDVALFASNGLWDAYYSVCWSNPDTSPSVGGGFTCTGAPSTWAGFGGTSVSSPIMAAIQALVNQKTGSRWGNPNTVYYALANTEYGTTGSATCNSNTVNKTSNSCKFYDITQGDIVGACKAQGTTLRNCFRPTGTNGILSTSNTVSQPAYAAGTGWDFGTGIGSVNAYNLVMGWPTN